MVAFSFYAYNVRESELQIWETVAVFSDVARLGV